MTFDTANIPAVLWDCFDTFDLPSADWHLVVDQDSPYFHYQCQTETSRPIAQAFLAPTGNVSGLVRNLPDAIRYCQAAHWRGIRLVATLRELDGRCTWPGGYDAPSHYAANQQYWEETYGEHPSYVEVDGMPGIDPRFVSHEQDDCGILSDLRSLESYPLLDEDLAGEIELKRQDDAWESWGESDWKREVLSRLADAIADNLDADDDTTDPETVADSLLEGKDSELAELFRACCDQTNTYWDEESDGSQWIRLEDAAKAIDLADLRDLTGLQLLPPDQRWRREAYPWADGSADPLAAPLSIAGVS